MGTNKRYQLVERSVWNKIPCMDFTSSAVSFLDYKPIEGKLQVSVTTLSLNEAPHEVLFLVNTHTSSV